MSEKNCKSCHNLEKVGSNSYTCAKGVFKQERGADIWDEEHADYCGKYKSDKPFGMKSRPVEESMSKFEKYLLEAKSQDYYFVIDADERGEFSAHIENENGKIKFNWSKDDCEEAGGFPPVVDGYMKNIKDMNGLRDYLDLPSLVYVG